MADEEHPDTTGAEPPEDPSASRDGEGKVADLDQRRKAEAVADRGEEGEEEQGPPPPPPIQGDHQLTLAGLGRRGLPITSQISIMSKTHPLNGMIKPDEAVTLVIRVHPEEYVYTPVREGNEVTGFKHTHKLRIEDAARAGTERAGALLEMDQPKPEAASG